jgi:hypothetical protein
MNRTTLYEKNTTTDVGVSDETLQRTLQLHGLNHSAWIQIVNPCNKLKQTKLL